jgi:hypothetical protein
LPQKSGRGEGLIYNIPSAHFQTTRRSEEILAQDGGARKGLVIEGQTSGNMRDDTSGRIEINESQYPGCRSGDASVAARLATQRSGIHL